MVHHFQAPTTGVHRLGETMASTFSGKKFRTQASGKFWNLGCITNNNLQKVESAIKGYVSIAIVHTDSLDTSDGSITDEQSNAVPNQ